MDQNKPVVSSLSSCWTNLPIFYFPETLAADLSEQAVSATLENSIPFSFLCLRCGYPEEPPPPPPPHNYLLKLHFVEEGKQGCRPQQGAQEEDIVKAQESALNISLAVKTWATLWL